MLTARRAWLLVAAATTGVACAQILGLEPWPTPDGGKGTGGAGGGPTTMQATGTPSSTASSSGTTTTTITTASSTGATTTSSTAASTSAASSTSGGPVCMDFHMDCFACPNCADDGGPCTQATNDCKLDTNGCGALLECALGCSQLDPTCIPGTCNVDAGSSALFKAWAKCFCPQCGSKTACTAIYDQFCVDGGP